MKLEFTDARWQQDDSGFWISLKVENPIEARRFLAAKKDKKYTAELKEWRERRSLDANAMCWAIIGKIAAKMGLPPETVYKEAIRDVGDNYEVMPVRNDALERWKTIWQSNGLGWLCEEIGPSKLEGYTNVRNFYGSSVYDRAQMSRLIDGLLEEARALGIDTMSDREKALLLEEW